MDLTLTAELLDPGDGNWAMGDCYHVFSSEEPIYPGLFFKSFFPNLLGLNDMLAMVGALDIATETQRASPLAQNVEQIVLSVGLRTSYCTQLGDTGCIQSAIDLRI